MHCDRIGTACSRGLKSRWQVGVPKRRWDGFMGCWRWREPTQALIVLLEQISKLQAAWISTPLAQNALSSRSGGACIKLQGAKSY
jgi:hypothetical protein